MNATEDAILQLLSAKKRVAQLERELRDILDWALIEKEPLRDIEIESIKRCLAVDGGVENV